MGFGQPAPGLDFSTLLANGSPNAIPTSSPAPVPNVDPATRFATQLQQMRDMGFTDQERAIEALTRTNGDVTAAVERMLAP